MCRKVLIGISAITLTESVSQKAIVRDPKKTIQAVGRANFRIRVIFEETNCVDGDLLKGIKLVIDNKNHLELLRLNPLHACEQHGQK